jgi:transcriptional regulator with XRE-family HTH domain
MAGRKARVTLTDIAAAAHVSVTTASNVANGRLELMSAPTRDRVEAVMRELNYRPDEGARSLRLAQRRAIGLIIVDDSPRFLADPMNTNILAGFSNYLSVNGEALGCRQGPRKLFFGCFERLYLGARLPIQIGHLLFVCHR